MRKKLILKCWLISLLTAAIVFAASVGILYVFSVDGVEKAIVQDTAVYADLLSSSGENGLEMLRSVEHWNFRITVLSAEGEPLFDSAVDGLKENHLDREEVQAALAGTPKIVERYSSSTRGNMLYYAVLTEGETPYILRIAEPVSELWSFAGTSVPFVVMALVISLILSYALAQRAGKAVSAQMSQIRDGLKELNNGGYRPVPAEMTDAEHYAIVSEMNLLFERMQRHFDDLKEERAKQDFILNRISQGIVAFDGGKNVVFLNESAKRLFGNAEAGESVWELVDDTRLCEQLLIRLERGGQTLEWNYRGKDLQLDCIRTTKEGLSHEIDAILICSDVSKEKEALRVKSEFFANASHELKTPLTSLQGLSELLLQKKEWNDQTEKYLQRIHTESLRLNRLVLDMLYIDALETLPSGEKREIRLADAAEEVFREYREQAEKKHLQLTVSGDAVFRMAPRDAEELIGNLVGNAVHYNRENGSVEVRFTETSSEVRMEVKDTGIGIDRADLPHLTERFFRVDKSRSKKTGGTGLGLAIVKHIVLRYQGQLSFESEPGKGTTVTVRLKKESSKEEK